MDPDGLNLKVLTESRWEDTMPLHVPVIFGVDLRRVPDNTLVAMILGNRFLNDHIYVYGAFLDTKMVSLELPPRNPVHHRKKHKVNLIKPCDQSKGLSPSFNK